MTARPRATLIRRDDYSSIWLKYVTGVDLSVHCIGSLIGPRQNGISRDAPAQEIVLDQHLIPAAFYLCGVTQPYRWDRNAHLAFQAVEGQSWEGPAMAPDDRGSTRHSLWVQLEDALPIQGWGEASIPDNDPLRADRMFRTCRNWQFAHEAAKRLGWTSRRNPESARYGRTNTSRHAGQRTLL